MFRSIVLVALASAGLFCADGARATTARTFVSISGSDANTAVNCAPTTPCRTFAAALGVTSSGGEIVVLSSGGYGPVTIGQSVSITAPDGIYAGISVAAGAGITVATAGVSVALKGLTINGTGGTYGIYMTNGSALTVVNCVIAGFGNSAAADAGIYVKAGIEARLINVLVRDNFNGIYLDGGAVSTIAQSQVLGNLGTGIVVANTNTGGSSVTIAYLSDTLVNGNAAGVTASGSSSTATGYAYASNVVASGNTDSGFEATANGTLVAGNCVAMNNGQYGLLNSGGVIDSAGNNTASGNGLGAVSGITATGGISY